MFAYLVEVALKLLGLAAMMIATAHFASWLSGRFPRPSNVVTITCPTCHQSFFWLLNDELDDLPRRTLSHCERCGAEL